MPDVKRRWIEERDRDVYHRRAKELGYRSRAAFKLMEMDRMFRLLGRGMRVLELGSSPGGWTQYASERVGRDGLVVAVDEKGVEPLGLPQATFVRANVMDESLESSLANVLTPGTVDLVLSDLAPNMTGRYEVDHERQMALARRALEVSRAFLRRRGNMVVKVFEGELSPELERMVESMFSRAKKFKPAASRKRSTESYLLCFGFRG